MTRPRVVHVTTTDISLALLLAPQLLAFRDAGYDVIGASATGAWTDRLRELGIAHEPLRHATRSWAPVKDVRALVELWRLVRRLRPDIVHTHNPKPGIYGRIAARLAGAPIVVNTVHGLYAMPEDRWRKRFPVYALERVAAACSDVELVQGPEDLDTLAAIGVPRRKLVLLGNGVDLARFDPSTVGDDERRALRTQMGADDDTVVCGVVSRLVREKGLDEVVAAARELRARAPSALVVVVGIADPDKADGFGPADIAAAERDAGIVFLGARDDMPACYAAMDLLVFPSHREGFPRAPMEAAAMGRPVVASDIRGCREAVEHGVTGLLVPAQDAAALARAVGTLVADAEGRARMGEAGRRKAQRDFDDRTVIAATLAIYDRLLRSSGRAATVLAEPSPGVIVREARVEDAAAAARVHCEALPHSFLAHLGPSFLGVLYRRAVRDRESFLLVGELSGEGIVGAAMATEDVRRLYRRFLVRDGLRAVVAAAPALLRRWRDVVDIIRYPSAASADVGDLPRAEWLSLGVSDQARGRGLGRALGQAVVEEYARRGVTRARLVVGDENDAALAVHRRVGFRPVGRVEVHAGAHQGVWVWP